MRNPFTRTVPVPADVVARAGLPRGDRVLAGAEGDDGTWLLGTRDALVVLAVDDAPRSLPWERVETADWDRDLDRLRVVEVAEFGQVRPVHELTVPRPGLLLQLIRERVTASVLLTRRVPVEGKRGLRVIARRPPCGRGQLVWACELDPGLDADDPVVRVAAEAALRDAQDELGPGRDTA